MADVVIVEVLGENGENEETHSRRMLARITVDPGVSFGKLCIRGSRLSVNVILEQLSAGDSPEEIPQDFDWLEMDDIKACLWYVGQLSIVKGRNLDPNTSRTDPWRYTESA